MIIFTFASVQVVLQIILDFVSIWKSHKCLYFSGESMDPDAMICMVEYKDVNGTERPVLYFFKHGLREEKC